MTTYTPPSLTAIATRARISHHPSAADADPLAVTGRTPSSRLDVVSATPAPSSGPCAPPQRRLDALATKCGEKCGLAERRHGSRQVSNFGDRLAPHYRERDFGIGYGRSSGYVRVRSYTTGNDRPLFRVG